MQQTFAFDHDPRFGLLLLPFGVTAQTSGVTVTDRELVVRFGVFSVRTPLANVAGTEVTGPYKAYRAIGPRMSLADRGATFGTSTRAGVCICFHEPVRALDPVGLLRHPALTVTVADVDGLTRALAGPSPSAGTTV